MSTPAYVIACLFSLLLQQIARAFFVVSPSHKHYDQIHEWPIYRFYSTFISTYLICCSWNTTSLGVAAVRKLHHVCTDKHNRCVRLHKILQYISSPERGIFTNAYIMLHYSALPASLSQPPPHTHTHTSMSTYVWTFPFPCSFIPVL